MIVCADSRRPPSARWHCGGNFVAADVTVINDLNPSKLLEIPEIL